MIREAELQSGAEGDDEDDQGGSVVPISASPEERLAAVMAMGGEVG